MKHLNRLVFALSFVFLASLPTFAQDEIDQLLGKSASDGEKLIGAYIAPFMRSVSSGLNQGWYNTAKPHKLIGIDITVTANAMSIPNSDLYYNVAGLKLETIEQDETSPYGDNVPTIFGPEKAPIYRFKDDPTGETFEGPGGLDLKGNVGMNSIPVPMAQIGIGLPKGTDLKVRFIPSIDLGDDSQLKMIGFGVMHDVKQWIPGLKLMPFDLSGFVGYTRLSIESKFTSEDMPAPDPANKDQHAEFAMSATTIQGIISKKISVLTVYGGVGYNIAKAKIGVKGTFDYNEDGDWDDTREKDPINLDYTTSGPRMTAGFRLKLAILTLHADYTLQKYRCLTVGVGLSVR